MVRFHGRPDENRKLRLTKLPASKYEPQHSFIFLNHSTHISMSLLDKAIFLTGSVRVQAEQLPVSTHVAGGNTDTRGTPSRVPLVPSVATVRHSHSVFSQHRHQTACSGELLVKCLSFYVSTSEKLGFGAFSFIIEKSIFFSVKKITAVTFLSRENVTGGIDRA
jgi:hypothetical protein